MHDRLDRIEALLIDRPGAAVDELEDATLAVGSEVVAGQETAEALLRNEDFAGAAHAVFQNSYLLHRVGLLILEAREQTRLRR